jgi:hypothetical protein
MHFARKGGADIRNDRSWRASSLTPLKLVDPVEAAVERVAAVADMDMQLADRAQSRRSSPSRPSAVDITGYRRVIHPEVSKGGSCGLCIAASDRVYSHRGAAADPRAL